MAQQASNTSQLQSALLKQTSWPICLTPAMDPVSGLPLACNIIQLVETAIKCGTAVIEVYNSVDGLPNAHKTVEREAYGIADVVGHLRDHQAQLQFPGFDSEIRNLTSRIVGQCDELRRILDECRPRKRGNVFSAGRATLKSLGKTNDIQRLQRELDFSRKRLNLLITIRTQYVAPSREIEKNSLSN